MAGYNFYCRCPLKHQISMDKCFIGKRIPILLLGKYNGVILFPESGKGDKDDFLFEPSIKGVNSSQECGICSHTWSTEAGKVLFPHFSSICFLFYIKDIDANKIALQVIEELERLTSKFVKCISLIRPNAIRWSLAREEEYVEAISIAYRHRILNQEEWTQLICLDPYGATTSEFLTIEEFWGIFKNISKEISLQYELLADIFQCQIRYEYREVILNCATIIEVTLKEQIDKYLDKLRTTEDDKKYILKSIDGFNKILKATREYGISDDNCDTIKQGTIKIRNKVIHGRYFPTKEEVEQAIEDAKQILRQYKVPLLIE